MLGVARCFAIALGRFAHVFSPLAIVVGRYASMSQAEFSEILMFRYHSV